YAPPVLGYCYREAGCMPWGLRRRGTSVASMARDRLGALTLAAAYTILAAWHQAGTVVPGGTLAAALLSPQDLLVAALLVARPSVRTVSRQWSDRLVAAAALLVPFGLHAPGAAVTSRHERDEREPSTIMVVKALVHTGRDAAFLFAAIRPIHTAATQKTPSHAIRLSYRDAGVESAPTMMAFPMIPDTTNRANLAAWT